MPLWDQVKDNLKEWYALAADKTEEAAKIGVRKYDRFGISRDLERQLMELGGLVYEGLQAGRADILQDPELHAVVERIRQRERDLQEKAAEIERIRREHRERAGGRPPGGTTAGGQAGGPTAAGPAPDTGREPEL